MSARKTPDESGENAVGFEKALERLEKIVGEMEGGELSLEKMMAYFEEGQKLIDVCSKRLNEVERRIEKLVKKGDAEETVPFDPEEAGGEAGGEGKMPF